MDTMPDPSNDFSNLVINKEVDDEDDGCLNIYNILI